MRKHQRIFEIRKKKGIEVSPHISPIGMLHLGLHVFRLPDSITEIKAVEAFDLEASAESPLPSTRSSLELALFLHRYIND